MRLAVWVEDGSCGRSTLSEIPEFTDLKAMNTRWEPCDVSRDLQFSVWGRL